MTKNPLLTLDHQEFPDFPSLQPHHFPPAIAAKISELTDIIDTVAKEKEPPTIANTVEPLEIAERKLNDVLAIFFHLYGTNTNDELDAIAQDYAPQLAAVESSIYLNSDLFARFKNLYEQKEGHNYSPETLRLLTEKYKDFISKGAQLPEKDKQQLRELEATLASLLTTFQNKATKALKSTGVLVEDVVELAGLSDEEIATAQHAAHERNLTGYWLEVVYPTQPTLISSLHNANVRQQLLTASRGRNSQGDDNDTTELIKTIALLRLRKAQLLGFSSYAELIIDRNTAPSVAAVTERLSTLSAPTVKNVASEQAELEKFANQKIEPWDWVYFSEKLRDEKYAVNTTEIAQYFPLSKVINDGVFFVAEKLYGLRFTPRDDLATYDPDVKIWQIDNDQGERIALFLLDPYSRPTKRGGAWMNNLRSQSELLGDIPIVANTLNVIKPTVGEAYLDLDQVTTAFHEFGHALHGFLSRVYYPSQSGTNVPRDYVEFPSQVNEIWALWPQVLDHYSQHSKTGESIPGDLLEAIKTAEKFGSGFRTAEYLGASVIDWAYHTITDEKQLDVPWEEFEQHALAAYGLDIPAVPPRYRAPYFAHIFSNDYAAGYYGYIWAEVLAADAGEWFFNNNGLTRENGAKLAQEVLSKGGSVDPLIAYEKVTNAPAAIEPLLQRRGLL